MRRRGKRLSCGKCGHHEPDPGGRVELICCNQTMLRLNDDQPCYTIDAETLWKVKAPEVITAFIRRE